MAENTHFTDFDFDKTILGDKLSLFKILIPYVDIKKQFLFALLIRIIEFKMTLDFYKTYSGWNSISAKDYNMDNIINDIKRHCPPEYKGMLEQMTLIMNMSEYMELFSKADNIMNSFTSKKTETPSNSTADLLKGMLSEDQKKLFEDYSKLLNI